MSVHQRGHRWIVRWRDGARNRSKTFLMLADAEAFNAVVATKPPVAEISPEGYALIPLAGGGQAMVDVEDAWVLMGYWWRRHSGGYAMRTTGPTTVVLMHRQIAGLDPGDELEVDHINGNRLDNRRANLRIVTHEENMIYGPRTKYYNSLAERDELRARIAALRDQGLTYREIGIEVGMPLRTAQGHFYAAREATAA